MAFHPGWTISGSSESLTPGYMCFLLNCKGFSAICSSCTSDVTCGKSHSQASSTIHQWRSFFRFVTNFFNSALLRVSHKCSAQEASASQRAAKKPPVPKRVLWRSVSGKNSSLKSSSSRAGFVTLLRQVKTPPLYANPQCPYPFNDLSTG